MEIPISVFSPVLFLCTIHVDFFFTFRLLFFSHRRCISNIYESLCFANKKKKKSLIFCAITMLQKEMCQKKIGINISLFFAKQRFADYIIKSFVFFCVYILCICETNVPLFKFCIIQDEIYYLVLLSYFILINEFNSNPKNFAMHQSVSPLNLNI